jgi:hypothetical protein
MSDLARLVEAGTVDPLVGHPADYHVFHKFLERCKELSAITTAVCWPLSDVALSGAVEAAAEGLIQPTLVGDEAAIKELAAKIGVDISGFPIVQANTESKAAELSVALCRSGEALAMMKGSLHTDELMKAVMQRETGLRSGRRISHVFVMDTPAYARTVLITDAAINIAPELEDKIHIVQNAIDLAHALGIPEPKVALLSAMETVNPKIQSTLDAAALCKMADRRQIKGGILDGPLAFDTAVSVKAAEDQGTGFPCQPEGRHSGCPGPGKRQHAGQATGVLWRSATGRHRAWGAGSDHSHEPCGLGRDAAHKLRSSCAAALCEPSGETGLTIHRS